MSLRTLNMLKFLQRFALKTLKTLKTLKKINETGHYVLLQKWAKEQEKFVLLFSWLVPLTFQFAFFILSLIPVKAILRT